MTSREIDNNWTRPAELSIIASVSVNLHQVSTCACSGCITGWNGPLGTVQQKHVGLSNKFEWLGMFGERGVEACYFVDFFLPVKACSGTR